MGKKKKKNKKVKRKLKYKNILLFLLLIILIVIFYFSFFCINLSTTYISGNNILSDEEIIKIANIKKNPFKNSIFDIKKRLKNNKYILSVSITKKDLFKNTYITIKENKPLFIYNDKVILTNGDTDINNYNIPVVTNEINGDVYNEFLNNMAKVNDNILVHISEIKYEPNDVDKKRFLLTMNDGNYVYLTLNTFNNINNYLKIIKNFEGKKGILYLDSGKYFKSME